MRYLVRAFAASSLFIAMAASVFIISIATPASAAIDPALDKEFFDAATRAVHSSILESSHPKAVDGLDAAAFTESDDRIFEGKYNQIPVEKPVD